MTKVSGSANRRYGGLNRIPVRYDERWKNYLNLETGLQEDHSTSSKTVSVHFKNLKQTLIDTINANRGSVMVGCVAWMTDRDVLDAIRENALCSSFILNKEDWLALAYAGSDRRHSLRKTYDGFRAFWASREDELSAIPLVLSTQSETDQQFSAFRCCGFKAEPASWLMHNKFMVFCDYTEVQRARSSYPLDFDEKSKIDAKTVWTGSFNFTPHGQNNFENAVVISDATIANAYFCEWGQIAALSEPLDWNPKKQGSDRFIPPIDWDDLDDEPNFTDEELAVLDSL
ncbi:phospholipase D-like domain-containing protein [Rhizobium laguerreae]|uniref:phospholipase D-like domain-containing protein n=1 Tax=Rhizobium laguerreae TaxID=1076926 RepID=UPI002FFFE1FF